ALSLNAVPIMMIDGSGTLLAYQGEMIPISRQRFRLVSGAVLAALVPPLRTAANAETPPRPPGEVPFIAFPQPTPTQSDPSDAPSDAPAAEGRPKPDALQQHDRDLQAIRGEQKKARDTETGLKREIERIGDERRKLNRLLIDLAGRVRTIEQDVTATEQRLVP